MNRHWSEGVGGGVITKLTITTSTRTIGFSVVAECASVTRSAMNALPAHRIKMIATDSQLGITSY